jgi:GNAT superfamily N-acetyltransferase
VPHTQPPAPLYRRLARADLPRLSEIDRTERIEALYVQRGQHLERMEGSWSATRWSSDGDGAGSVGAKRAECEQLIDRGAVVLGAFDGSRLAGMGSSFPTSGRGSRNSHSCTSANGPRAPGIGRQLVDQLEHIARDAGDAAMVVSATPTENTERIYLGRGFAPLAAPLPELYELEPEDVHMSKRL